MRSKLTRFAITGLAALAMATSASADTILQFAQQATNTTPIAAVASGGVTTLSTTGPGSTAGSVPVLIGFGGAPPTIAAFETFTTPLTSGATANQAGTMITQDAYGGTIKFSSLAGGGGTNFLTASFSGGLFSGTAGGNSAALSASAPPSVVTFSSDIPALQVLIAASTGRNLALSFSGLTNPLSLTPPPPTVSGFNASNTGTFSTNAIPEPTSVVMASISALVGLGCYGLRRFKVSQA